MRGENGDDHAIDRRVLLRGVGATVALGSLGGVGRSRAHASQGTPLTGRVVTTEGTDSRNTISIRAASQQDVFYEFSASGSVTRGGPYQSDSGDEISGNTVSGAVGEGRADSFVFTGEITSFTTEGGPARVFVNGQEVEDPVGLPGGGGGGGGGGQARDCVPVRGVRSNEPVTDFYGYVSNASEPNSQQSNTGLEEPGVSRLFFYRGPEGLSLIIIHGGGEGEQGGAATFEVTGLPSSGEWVVLDDNYEGAIDEFQLSGSRAVLNWTWGAQGRNDGAVFRGLGEDFEVRIDPAFNEAAALDPVGDGRITEWQLLSATDGGFEAYSLPLDQPVVLSTDEC